MKRPSNPHQRLEEGSGKLMGFESPKMTLEAPKKSMLMPSESQFSMDFESPKVSLEAPKKSILMRSESLFSMALYDFDTSIQCETGVLQHPQQQQQLQLQQCQPQPTFHPVEGYNDLSLNEFLDLSDNFMFGDEDLLMSSLMMMDPVPYPVASRTTPQVSSDPTPQVTPSFHLSHGSTSDMGLSLDMEDSSKKRRRESHTNDDDDCSKEDRRLRPYQAVQWAEKFEELCEYRHNMGHCIVRYTYGENLPLAGWVKRQRHQYKLMVDGKQSAMTDERVTALEDIGFVWDSQGAAWAEHLNELAEFHKIYMHCKVPSNYNSQLATWVKSQRRQYMLRVKGKASNMTPMRISSLENMGFEWERNNYKKARTN
jgi:hypothetical protein